MPKRKTVLMLGIIGTFITIFTVVKYVIEIKVFGIRGFIALPWGRNPLQNLSGYIS